MLAINEDRMLADLRALAEFGKVGTGVSRPAFSDADIDARRWLMGQMQSAGLEAAIDGIGNVYGRSPVVAQSILVGSHSDSVPNGGWLDGALGVIYALEVARAAQAYSGEIGVDVISFGDEEGTWLPCLGSRCFCGEVDGDALYAVHSRQGERLADRLAAIGLQGRALSLIDPERHRAYLEAHIEQGPRLVNGGTDIGIVTGIVGLRRHVVHFRGRADHAGTTPMAMRKDAAFAMFNFAIALAEALRVVGSADSVWNFGIVAVRPGAGNVVPAEADLTVEFRDADPTVIDRLEDAFLKAVRTADGRYDVAVSSVPNATLDPAAMDGGLMDDLAAAAAAAGASTARMPSGAGHDAMILARRIPAAMMFVPSIDGRSHDVTENTSEADIRRGLRVFAGAVSRALARYDAAARQAPHSPRRKEPAA